MQMEFSTLVNGCLDILEQSLTLALLHVLFLGPFKADFQKLPFFSALKVTVEY